MNVPQWKTSLRTTARLVSAVLAAAVLSGAAARGDETVRQVQEELRKRNLYFGDVDGRSSRETEAALRRYQERKGFSATGEATPETLASLGLGTVSEGASWPDLPVLRSDAARAVSEKERARLDQLAQGMADLPPVAEPPPESEAAEPQVSTVPAEAQKPNINVQVERFLHEYLTAGESGDLRAEMAFYADRVDYFDHGVVNHAFIEEDIGQKYYRRWPHRRYKLLSVRVLPAAAQRDEIVVRFRIRFEVKNGSRSATGQTDNTFAIHREADGKMRFVTLRERRVRG